MMKRRGPPGIIRRLPLLFAPLSLTGCQAALLDPRGPIGIAEKTILVDTVAIMLAIVIPTLAAIAGFAWWFRASNERAIYLPHWHFSGRIEMVVWGIPALTILLLGGVAWIGSHDLDPAVPIPGPPPLEIEAISLDWKWLFIYPGQRVAVVNELVIPAGVPVHFSLTSASVMNAFFIPQLGSMIYTMNGMTTRLNLKASDPGEFLGLSSHFSGDGFSDMHFEVRAVTQAQFDAWVQSSLGSGNSLDAARYAQLVKQSIADRPVAFRLTDLDLFGKIVTQEVPPGPGPQTGRGGPDVSPH